MSSVIFNISPRQVIIVSDTLATQGDAGTPYFFTTKFYTLPHLFGVMFATGIGDLATEWFVQLERFLARDILHLDEFVTPSLIILGNKFKLDKHLTTTIYHVGFSFKENQYVGFAYRSTNNFESERLEYGLRVKPPVPNPEAKVFPVDYIHLMERQISQESKREPEDRVFIGGEVQCIVLEDLTMNIATIHRFPDYEDLYSKMCEQIS